MEPTYIDKRGSKYWRVDGYLHRVDGQSIEWFDGTKYWYIHNRRHRIDGPAIEHTNGGKAWWLNDTEYSYEEWKVKVRKYYETDEDYLLMLLKLD
jgi:hypothetical protein